jgi:hypothetical protein
MTAGAGVLQVAAKSSGTSNQTRTLGQQKQPVLHLFILSRLPRPPQAILHDACKGWHVEVASGSHSVSSTEHPVIVKSGYCQQGWQYTQVQIQ